MGDPNNPQRLQLWITPPGTELDIAREIQQRAEALKEQEWQGALQGPSAATTEGAPAEPPATEAPAAGPKKLAPPIESTSEQVRNRAQAAMNEPAVKKIVDTVFQTLTGADLATIQKGIETGTLPDMVSMKLNDPLGRTFEALARKTAESTDVPPDVAERAAQMTGLMASLFFPFGKGKAAEKAVEETAKVAGAAKAGVAALRGALKPGEANINVGRIAAAEDVKKTITRLNQLMAERLAGSRAPVTHAQTIEAGRALGMTIEEALAIPDEQLSLEGAKATQMALRDLHNKVASVVNDLRAEAMKGDAAAAEDLARTWMVAGEIGAKDEMIGSGSGRILEARKIMSQADRAAFTAEEFAAVRDKMGANGVDGFALARYLTQVQGQRAKAGALTALWNGYKTINDALHYLFLQAVLSWPVTHAANIVGTAATSVWHFPERYVAEWINRAFFHDAAGVQRGETWAMMHASGQGASDGLRMMGRAIRTAEQPFGAGRIEARFDLTAAQFGLDPTTPVGKIADVAGMIMPTRLMMGEDAFYKGFVYRTEMAALALREAMARSHDPAEIERATAALFQTPTPEMQRMAVEAANLRTLNAELGAVGSKVIALRNTIPGGWVIAPFLQTPGNSYKWFYQRAPLLSLTSVQNWSDVTKGGATRDLAMSRMLIGSAIGGAVAWHVLNGDITGGMPVGSNRNLKRDYSALGPKPYTIRVGDEYYGYKRTDPVGTYLGAIATAIEIYTQLAEDDVSFQYEDFAIAAALAGSRVALDTPWLSGASNVLDAIARPDVDSKKMAQGFARSLVPAVVRGITRLEHPEIKELDSLLDVIKADVPWLTNGVAPVLHPITGETIERPPGWGVDGLSPIFISHRRDDPVLMEIIRNKMNFAEPRKVVGIEENLWSTDPTQGQPNGVKLSQGQYFTLKHIATHELRNDQGQTLHEAMLAEVASDAYRRASDGPDGGKEARLKIIYQNAYKLAMMQLRREDSVLDTSLRALREQAIRQQQPTDSPEYRPGRIPAGLPPSLMNSLGR